MNKSASADTPEPEAATPEARRTVGILVPTDFSALAQVAVDAVLTLVKDQPEVKVTLLHVVEPWHVHSPTGFELPAGGGLSHRVNQAEQEMERLRSRHGAQIRMDARVLAGNPARVICDLAESEHFRIIILSSHGHTGLARVFIGSVAERVVQDASCPVLVVKPRRDEAEQFIMKPVDLKLNELLVGYDHRNGSKRALSVARAIAKRAGACITLVHAIEPPSPSIGPCQPPMDADRECACMEEAREWLQKVAASHEASARKWTVRVEAGHPWDVIIDAAKACSSDLIVVGPHDHTRWGHCFIGSTAQRVVRLAPCSVLAVK